jgi:hypothetical protein
VAVFPDVAEAVCDSLVIHGEEVAAFADHETCRRDTERFPGRWRR